MAVVVFLTGAALKLAAPVVIVLLLTVLLVYLIDPLVVVLNNRLRLPLWLSALIAIIFFGAVFAGLGVLIFFDLPHFARTFPKFQDEIIRRAQRLTQGLENNLGFTFAVDPFEEIRTAPIRPVLMGLVRSSLRFISEFILIFFFAVILLVGKYRLIHILLTVFPRRHSMVPIVLKHVDRHLRAFLGIKALASLIIGIGTAGILLAFRVEFAVTWGFFTILLNFVPTLGPLTAIVLPTLVSMIQYPNFIMPGIHRRMPGGAAPGHLELHRAAFPGGAARPLVLRDLPLAVLLGLDVGSRGSAPRGARHRLPEDHPGKDPRHIPHRHAPGEIEEAPRVPAASVGAAGGFGSAQLTKRRPSTYI